MARAKAKTAFSMLEVGGEEELSALYTKIDRELHAWLKQYTKKHNITVKEFIEQKIRETMKAEGEYIEDIDLKLKQYERLKKAHEKLIQKRDKLLKQLQKRKVYAPMVKLAVRLGLDTKKLSNLDQIIPRMIREHRGNSEDLHLFITFLETVKKKEEIQNKLTQIRSCESSKVTVTSKRF